MVDTRTDSSGGLITGTVRNLTLTGAAYSGFSSGNPCTALTGIPGFPTAVSVNFTMVGAAGNADLRVAPWGTAPTSSVMNTAGPTIANAASEAVFPDAAGGSGISVKSGGASFNLLVDVLGYYVISENSPSAIVEGSNSGGGAGVFGVANSGVGVVGLSNFYYGVYGESTSGTGINGQTLSVALDQAGVLGQDGSGATLAAGWDSAGVRGESQLYRGVIGFSTFAATTGVLVDSGGIFISEGLLGWNGYGLYGFGDFAATGTKSFVEPHPTNPAKEIRYVSLEGPESGTYFRGSAQIVNGFATIEVPESFRDVTDQDGLTVQLTPVGGIASMGVVSEDLVKIVVQSSRDLRFHYLVNGVRRAFKDFQAISDNKDFVPESPNDHHFRMYPAESQRRLVATGIYNADGTVNMATAQKMGWDKAWAARKAKASAASAAPVAALHQN
jgi:hypothetical protein